MSSGKKNLLSIGFGLFVVSLGLPAAALDQAAQPQHVQEIEVHMREAEQQLEAAAARIAELSTEQLARAGEVGRRFMLANGRPVLGITISSDEGHEPVEGVEVMGVSPSGAADEAGLRSGDIIVAINGDSMTSENSSEASRKLLDFMQGVEQGDVLEIDYLRDGKNGSVELTPRESSEHFFNFRFGDAGHNRPGGAMAPVFAYSWMDRSGHGFGEMEMVELNKSLGRYFGTDSGLLVIKAPSDNAYQLQDGDVIKNIDGRTPNDLRHAVRILSSYQSGETVNIEIMRDKRKKTITVQVPDNRRSFVRPRPLASPASTIVIAPKVKVIRTIRKRT